MRFDEHFIRGALSDVEIINAAFPERVRCSVDTRTLEQGDIFIALSGNHHDGHLFLEQAFQKGAAGCIIAADKKNLLHTIKPTLLANTLIIAVPNTLQALLRLAVAWRCQFTYPVVAITGSVGKTSTKEILARILEVNGNAYIASEGNQNTRIGVALNILRMRSSHQMAIFEVGINKRGEMAEIARMLLPTTAVITGIGHCHMEGLGSLADIALEKRDLFSQFSEDSIGIINGDQPLLAHVGYPHPVIKFGSKTMNQIQARKVHITSSTTSFVLKMYKEKYPVTIQQMHQGVVFNSLAAAAVAHLLGVSNEVIVKAIEQPLIVPGRFERRMLNNHKGSLINDCYNANPESMKAALLAFQKIETSAQKIAVLGDMLELGMNSPFWHRQLGRFLRKVPSLRYLILVGSMVKWTKKTAPVGLTVDIVPTWKEAIDQLKQSAAQESLVLVKGSRSVGLDNLVDAICLKEDVRATTAP